MFLAYYKDGGEHHTIVIPKHLVMKYIIEMGVSINKKEEIIFFLNKNKNER